MDNDVVDKCPLGIKHRRILALTVSQLRHVVHGDVLHSCQGLGSVYPNVAHVADIKGPYARAHGQMLLHQSARLGVVDRHVPAAEVDHLRSKLTMNGIQGCLANRRGGLGFGWQNLSLRRAIGANLDG